MMVHGCTCYCCCFVEFVVLLLLPLLLRGHTVEDNLHHDDDMVERLAAVGMLLKWNRILRK